MKFNVPGGECLSLGHLLRTWPPAISDKVRIKNLRIKSPDVMNETETGLKITACSLAGQPFCLPVTILLAQIPIKGSDNKPKGPQFFVIAKPFKCDQNIRNLRVEKTFLSFITNLHRNCVLAMKYADLFFTLLGFLCSYRGISSIFPSNQFPFNNPL
jgi:hypothetical protein